MSKKQQYEKLWSLYNELWEALPKKKHCSSCGKQIYGENKSIYWDHLLDKSKFPELMYEAWNLYFVCGDCHSQKSMGHPTRKHQAAIDQAKENYVKNGGILK